MNAHCHKVIFSKRLGTLVAVGEHTASTGKAASGQGCRGSLVAHGFVGALRFTCASVALACLSLGNTQAQSSQIALATNALPQGGSVSTGSATISTSGANMAITQSTDKASINWQSFNIGTGASVNIAQPSSSAVLLNRVVGNDPSQILGQLKANGQVILLNPNGVLFGKDGSVTSSAFTASTFGLSDADFMAGYYKYNRNGSTAAVVNQGTIETSAGGFVALIGATVTNEGTIRAPQGDVVMAAAESVALPEDLVSPQAPTTPNTVSVRMSKRVLLELTPAAVNTAVNNTDTGVIVTEGGQVLMQASALATAVASVTQSGHIDTSAPQAGAVTLLADNGEVKVSGRISANSNSANKGGDIIIGRDSDTGTLTASTDVSGATLESNGGFVETSGHQLTVDNTTVKADTWLLDPDNIDITNAATATTGYSKVSASDVSTALNAGANVVIHTTNGVSTSTSSIPYTASNPGEGNILVSSAISKTSGGDASLTLTADNGLSINAGITATGTGTGKLDITLTANGQTNGKAVGNMSDAEKALSRGVFIGQNGDLNANGGDINITGTSYADASASNTNATSTNAIGKGVYIYHKNTLTGNNITITGVANTQSASAVGYGVYFQKFWPWGISTLNATNNITITGTLQGLGTGVGLNFRNSDLGGQTPLMNATNGNITLRGNNRGSTSNTNSAVYTDAGLQAKAGGNVVVQAETNNAATTAINFYSPNRGLGPIEGNVTLQAGGALSNNGDVLIQSNKGGVALNNLQPTNGSTTLENKITGRNITIDNTGAGMAIGAGTAVTGSGGTQGASIANGGSIGNDGSITPGTGKATGNGINLADNRSITATGNFNLYGASNGNAWAVISAAQISAANFSVQGYNSNPNGNVNGGGLLLRTGASFVGTATNGSNLIKGTWGNSQYGATYGLLIGDSASSNITMTSATGSSLSVEGYNYMGGVQAGNLYYSPGIHTQGTLTTSGTVNMTGYSQVFDGVRITGTYNHSNSALSVNGTSQPFGYPASNGSSAGIQLLGTLNVSDSSNLTLSGTNKTTYAGNQSGSTGYGVMTGSSSQITGHGGTLNITGLTSLNSGLTVANLPKTVGIYASGNVSGWADTTLLGQNMSSSSLPAVQVMGNINVGTSALNVLANGGQIYQGTNSTFTAGRVTIDNTGAGRSSLFADYSVTPNITNGQSFGGSINSTTGAITMGNAAATTRVTNTGNALDLNGAINTTADIHMAANSGAYINSALTSTGGDINVQAKGTTEFAMGGVSSANNISASTSGGDIIQRANLTATGTVTLDNSTATGRSISRSAGTITANQVNLKTANQIGASDNRILAKANEVSVQSAGHQYLTGTAHTGTSMTVAAKSTVGAVDVLGNSATTIGSVDGVDGVSANAGVKVLTSTGDLTVAKSVANSASGNIFLGAGVNQSAQGSATNFATTGDIKTTSDTSVTISNTVGKTYLYTGSTSGTGLLKNLANDFSELRLSGDMGTNTNPVAQNADSNVAYQTNGAANTITNGAKAQVMFREKISLDTSTIAGTTFETTYGNANTANTTAGANELMANMVAKLKQANPGEIITRAANTTNGANTFTVSKATVLDSMNPGTLQNASYSTAGYLKANEAQTYAYGELTSSKYTASLDTGKATVLVKKLALTGSITGSSSEYGSSLVLGNATVNTSTKKGSDDISAGAVSINTAGNTSSSGNLKAGTHTGIQSVALTGADADNYSAANIRGDYTVTQKPIAASYVAKDKVFDGSTTADVTGTVAPISGDKVNVQHTSANFDSPDIGTAKTVTVSGISLSGADEANYKVDSTVNAGNTATTKASITAVPPKPPVPVVPTDGNSRVKVPVGSANPFALASAEDLADDTCSANSIENCYCEPSELNKQVDICYEPKAGAKGSAR